MTGTAAAAPVKLAVVVAAGQIVREMHPAVVAAAVQAALSAFGAVDAADAADVADVAAFAPAAASAIVDRVPSEQLPPLHHRLPALLPPSSSALRPPAPWVTAACAWSDWPTCAAAAPRASAWA